MGNGTFGSQGNWIISNTSHPVGNETGLAALALGTSTDYRVYYHDNQRAINQLISSGDSGWLWDGYISQDVTSSPAIHAAFTEKNVTLIAPRDSKNMEISRWNTDNSWHISMHLRHILFDPHRDKHLSWNTPVSLTSAAAAAPYPLNGNIVTETTSRSDISINSSASTGFTLPGWDGATKSIGISIDSTHSRYVWYIGTDRSLHEIGSFNFIWQGVSSQSSQFWPQADTPNAELAVTSDFSSSSVYIYYFVNQSLAEIKRVNNGWVPTAALATVDPASAATSTNTNTSAATDLSTGSKIGIGVGISASAIAVGGIAVLFLYSGRKAARRANMEKAEGTSRQASEYPSQSSPSKHELPAYKYQRAWHPASFSAPPHTALDAAPRPIVYELLAQPLIQELEGSEYPSPIPSRASPESGN